MLIAIRYALLMFVLCGIVYPLVITGLGQVLFPFQANGSLIRSASGEVVGSSLIGQNFTGPDYFHPRPSANNYDASNSGGSNLGPTNKKLIERVQKDALAYEQTEKTSIVPIDAVTTSGSGLDPDISLANALIQCNRIAAARGLSVEQLRPLIYRMQTKPYWGILGEPGVNVLMLNLALDQLKK
jgi:potassium-transporting ATPase KdpC subunit